MNGSRLGFSFYGVSCISIKLFFFHCLVLYNLCESPCVLQIVSITMHFATHFHHLTFCKFLHHFALHQVSIIVHFIVLLHHVICMSTLSFVLCICNSFLVHCLLLLIFSFCQVINQKLGPWIFPSHFLVRFLFIMWFFIFLFAFFICFVFL